MNQSVIGFNGTPLARKLGLKEDTRVGFLNAPPTFTQELGALPPGARRIRNPRSVLDFALLFARNEDELRMGVGGLARRLDPTGMLWVAWPKKPGEIADDLGFDLVQSVGIEAGLVDTKICSINDVWSGLRFVHPLEGAPARRKAPARKK